MRLFGFDLTRVKQGAISVSMARGTSYFLGPINEGYGGAWQRNVLTESNENLLRFSAVYACISRIANDISILRPMLMRIGSNGIWTEQTRESPYLPVFRKPNPYQNWIQLLAYWLIQKLIYGNAYLLKERDSRGIVIGLYPLDSRSVNTLVVPSEMEGSGDVYYSLSGDVLAGVPSGKAMLPASEIIHDLMNPFWHPLCGVGPIYACGMSATQGMRIQNNSAKFFENMSRPSGHLSHPGKVTPEDLARLKEQFESGFSAGNLGRLLVTGGDAKYQPITIPAEQSQLIEQQNWTVEDVCRAFGVPLHKIAAGNQPTFSNIGAFNQQYYDETLKVHIEAIERLLTDELAVGPQYGVELDLESLLRMDPKTRAETAEIFIRAGAKSPDEVRFIENLPPVNGGDSPYMQQQNYQLGALAKRDAKADPFATEKPALPAPPVETDEEDDDEADADEKSLIIQYSADVELRRDLGMPG